MNTIFNPLPRAAHSTSILPASQGSGNRWGALVAQCFLGLVLAGLTLHADPPIRLTLDPGQDINPAWDPRGDTIAYMRSASTTGSGVPYNLYQVQAGTPGESVMATGPTSGFGLANSPSWIGSTGFLGIEERAFFHEYLKFDASKAPFTRTVLDGNDAAFTRLLAITGGGGGGWIRFSRDGTYALWRWATSGGSGTQQIRVGPVNSLTGQGASSAGSVVAETFHSTEQRMTATGALSPDGSRIILCLPAVGPNGAATAARDLWLYHRDGSQPPVNLTQEAVNGVFSSFPDFFPDGSRIVYARYSGVTGETWDLYSIQADGTDRRQLTNTPHFAEYGASVSNDGKRIAFTGVHIAGYESTEPALALGEVANANIYVMDLVDQEPTELFLDIYPAVELEWVSEAGVRYQLQGFDDGTVWEDIGEPVPGTGEPIKRFESSRHAPHRLFRLMALP